MASNNSILEQAQVYVEALMREKLPTWAVYHNLQHTRQVAAAAEEISEGSGLSSDDREVVLLAAWMHDVGFIETVDGHEEKSVEIATQFLQSRNVPPQKIEQVAACIRATRIPQKPSALREQVMCDADLSHLGKKRFFERSDLLRMETELRTGTPMSDEEWLKKNIEFATTGNFFTAYAREKFAERRQKNLLALQEQLREVSARSEEHGKLKKGKAEATLEKQKKPDRGIETMFRVVPKNHLDLTALADHKASILIGTTGTIKAIIVSVLVSKLDTHGYLLIPTLLLLLTCLITMVFSILATRPNVTTGTFTREDIRQRKVNLLFFGNFHRSSLEDFDWGMREMMNDSDYLYGSMIKDLYFLGKVLGKKYEYLRLAYTVFMWGLIVSVLAYGIAIMNAPAPVPVQ